MSYRFILATYPVKHKETGEEKEVVMSVHDIKQWYEDNPEWARDWSKGASMPCDEGEWKNRLINKHPGWKRVLDKVKNAPRSVARDLY